MHNQELAKIFYEIADYLEMDGVAFKPFAWRKVANVLEAMEDGNIYEIFPDGHREFIKKSSPYIPSEIGKKIILQ